MLRVRESLQATRACAVEHDSHDVVSECGSGKTALKNEESEVGSGEHDSHDAVSECSSAATRATVVGEALRGLADCGIEGGVRSALGQRGDSGAETAHATAVESKRIHGLLEVPEPDADCTANAASAAVATVTAGESKGIIGSFQRSESDFPSLNSTSFGSLSSSCPRRVARSAATASARVCLGSSFPAVSAAVAHAHTSILHDACSNSWSDTGRVPERGRGSKVGFPVRPKICVLSQRWRQG